MMVATSVGAPGVDTWRMSWPMQRRWVPGRPFIEMRRLAWASLALFVLVTGWWTLRNSSEPTRSEPSRTEFIRQTVGAFEGLPLARHYQALVFPRSFGSTNRIFYGIERADDGYVTTRFGTSPHVERGGWSPGSLGIQERLAPIDTTLQPPDGFEVFVRREGSYVRGVLTDQLGPEVAIDVARMKPRPGSFQQRGVLDVRAVLINAGDRPGRFECELSWADQTTQVQWRAGDHVVAPRGIAHMRGMAIFHEPLNEWSRSIPTVEALALRRTSTAQGEDVRPPKGRSLGLMTGSTRYQGRPLGTSPGRVEQ